MKVFAVLSLLVAVVSSEPEVSSFIRFLGSDILCPYVNVFWHFS